MKFDDAVSLDFVVQPLLERTLGHEAVRGSTAFPKMDGRLRKLPLQRIHDGQVCRIVMLEILVEVVVK